MVNENKKTTIRLVELNNKSRKGTYIYIKTTGKKESYYKYDETVPIDAYTNHYKNKGKKTKHSIKTYRKAYTEALAAPKESTLTKKEKPILRQAQKYLRQVRSRPKINEAIKKGITYSHIKDAYTTNQNDINKSTRKMLQYLVWDPKLLDIISSEENIKKMTTRLEYRITLKNKEGEALATLTTFNKTPNKTVQEINENVKKGTTITGSEQEGTPDGYAATALTSRLEKKGYHTQHHKKGQVQTATVQIIFRKGK